MDVIYYYHELTGIKMMCGKPFKNPLDSDAPLLPSYTTPVSPPVVGDRECARYLNEYGDAPACHDDGKWVIHPDWRNVPLWSMLSGEPVSISDPGITPSSIGATDIAPPGPEYKWDDGNWVYDAKAAADITIQQAQSDLSRRMVEASSQLDVLKPAVDGGYAKPDHAQLLGDWQRYRYELTLVPEQIGWPDKPQWPDQPATVI